MRLAKQLTNTCIYLKWLCDSITIYVERNNKFLICENFSTIPTLSFIFNLYFCMKLFWIQNKSSLTITLVSPSRCTLARATWLVSGLWSVLAALMLVQVSGRSPSLRIWGNNAKCQQQKLVSDGDASHKHKQKTMCLETNNLCLFLNGSKQNTEKVECIFVVHLFTNCWSYLCLIPSYDVS